MGTMTDLQEKHVKNMDRIVEMLGPNHLVVQIVKQLREKYTFVASAVYEGHDGWGRVVWAEPLFSSNLAIKLIPGKDDRMATVVFELHRRSVASLSLLTNGNLEWAVAKIGDVLHVLDLEGSE